MRTGKVPEAVLKRSVLKYCGKPGGQLLAGAGAGCDCALLSVGASGMTAAAVHPAVIDTTEQIRYALEHAANNLACSGCLPAAALLTVLLPEQTEEPQLKELMKTAQQECEALGMVIAGGHTEVTAAVTKPVLSVTALGSPCAEHGKDAGSIPACPGRELVMAGWIAMEGTALLAGTRERELCSRFPADLVRQAKALGEHISIVEGALLARKLGAVYVHDLSQGGVFGALWELCERMDAGLAADLRAIPVKQETIEVCEYFGVNPYCLLSGGAFLAVTADGAALTAGLAGAGIPAAVIGRLTDSADRILVNGEERRYLDRPAQDEWVRL